MAEVGTSFDIPGRSLIERVRPGTVVTEAPGDFDLLRSQPPSVRELIKKEFEKLEGRNSERECKLIVGSISFRYASEQPMEIKIMDSQTGVDLKRAFDDATNGDHPAEHSKLYLMDNCCQGRDQDMTEITNDEVLSVQGVRNGSFVAVMLDKGAENQTEEREENPTELPVSGRNRPRRQCAATSAASTYENASDSKSIPEASSSGDPDYERVVRTPTIHVTGRRRLGNKKWTVAEIEALVSGVEAFSVGAWKAILATHSDKLRNRTGVDLKDKWRNLVKAANHAGEKRTYIPDRVLDRVRDIDRNWRE